MKKDTISSILERLDKVEKDITKILKNQETIDNRFSLLFQSNVKKNKEK